MRAVAVAAGLVWALSGAAQNQAKVDLTAGQIIEKSIEASGGRKVIEKLASTHAKGIMEMAGIHSVMELYAKAPNKRLIITNVEGFGEIRQGFDGKVAWRQDPVRGLAEETGAELADTARDATFNAELMWRDLYPKAEVLGREKVGEREAYVVRLTPATGKPVTRYYDAESFLLLRQVGSRETPQGPMNMRVDFSDYREVGDGIKAPFLLKQVLPVGQVIVRMTELKNNIDIDDATFSKPAPEK